MNARIIGQSDFEQIERMLQQQLFAGGTMKMEEFFTELETAQKVGDEQRAKDVVALNSYVELQDMSDHEVMRKKIVLPPADFDAHEVSVLSPLGMSVFGRKAGTVIDCPVPAGVRRIKVRHIL